MTVAVNSLVTGIGGGSLGGSGGTTDTADFDADADVTKTLIAQLVNARIAALSNTGADWSRLQCINPPSSAGDESIARYLGVNAVLRGIDSTAGAGSRLQTIEAKNGEASFANTMYRLLTDAALRARDVAAGGYMVIGGDRETVGGFDALLAQEQRATGYFACIRARRFVATSEGGAITVSNGFTATAPRFTIEAGATKELIIRRLRLYVLTAGTTNLQFRIVIDPDARYSSGGTTGTVGARVNANGGSATAAGFTFHYGGITATATDSDEREVLYGTIVNVTGNYVDIDFADGLIVPASGTLLLYLMDAGAAGAVAANFDLEEVDVQ